MDTYEMKIDVTLPDTPKALGDWANYEINKVIEDHSVKKIDM